MRGPWWNSRGLGLVTVLAATLTVISVHLVGRDVIHEHFLVPMDYAAGADATDITEGATLKSFPMQFCNCTRTIAVAEDDDSDAEEVIMLLSCKLEDHDALKQTNLISCVLSIPHPSMSSYLTLTSADRLAQSTFPVSTDLCTSGLQVSNQRSLG